MPKPETITNEDIALWDQEWDEMDPAEEGLPPIVKLLPGIKEKAWYPGQWLIDQLIVLECPRETRLEILQALGERNMAAVDPWVGAMEALEDYKNGIVNTSTPISVIDGKSVRFISDGNRDNSCEDNPLIITAEGL